MRGLDYYRHTAFEFVTDRLGAQGTVLAGGRYDGLVEALGGPATPAVGWAAGIERLGMMLDDLRPEPPEVAVIPENPALEEKAIAIAARLRAGQVRTELGFRGNVKKRSEQAAKKGALAYFYVREAGSEMGEYYFSYRGRDKDGAARLGRRVREALGEAWQVRGIE